MAEPTQPAALKTVVKAFTDAELIHHLIRLGAAGDLVPARNVQMLVMQQVRRLRAKGENEQADALSKSLTESGYDALKGFLR